MRRFTSGGTVASRRGHNLRHMGRFFLETNSRPTTKRNPARCLRDCQVKARDTSRCLGFDDQTIAARHSSQLSTRSAAQACGLWEGSVTFFAIQGRPKVFTFEQTDLYASAHPLKRRCVRVSVRWPTAHRIRLRFKQDDRKYGLRLAGG